MPLAAERPGGLRDEDVREHVRQVRDGGHRAVVVVGVDDQRPRADARDEPVHPLEQHAAGRALRREVPGGALEEVLPGVLDARDLGARERVPADEALVLAGRADDGALGRADVRHGAVRRGEREHLIG